MSNFIALHPIAALITIVVLFGFAVIAFIAARLNYLDVWRLFKVCERWQIDYDQLASEHRRRLGERTAEVITYRSALCAVYRINLAQPDSMNRAKIKDRIEAAFLKHGYMMEDGEPPKVAPSYDTKVRYPV